MCDWGGGPNSMANYYRPQPKDEDCSACEGEGCTYAVYGQLDTYEDCERCGGTGKKREAA